MTSIAQSVTGANRFSWTIPPDLNSYITEPFGLSQRSGSAIAFQALVLRWNRPIPPTREICRGLFNAYRNRRAFPLLVVLVGADGRTWVFGPTDEGVVQGPLSEDQVARILRAAFSESNPIAARKVVVHYFDSLSTSAMPGVVNTGLFASHYLRTSLPERADWEERKTAAQDLLPLRGEPLIRKLGYSTDWIGSTAMILRASSQAPRAVAVLLQENETFSEQSDRFLSSPVAHALSLAQEREIPWVVALRNSQIRLYSARATDGVGRRGQSETYLEIDLAVVDPAYQGLLPLAFSASALSPGGTTEELLRDSSRYSVELGARLRNRVYEEVVPTLSVAVAREMQRLGIGLDHHGIDVAYGATLRILFRLLFQAYAEDRGLLPYGRNEVYDRHALKTIAQELADEKSHDPSDLADSYWQEMRLAWRVIDKGDPSWGVPAYNGGLFSDDDPEGDVLAKISLPNSVTKAALRSLLVDLRDSGDPGPVDFRSLSVREFGTIYEGLLESSLTIAESDLTLDRDQTWVPAGPGDKVEAKMGEPYFHNASGARKATGSYFTPSFLVDHLIAQSLVPALEAHLGRIEQLIDKGDLSAAGNIFFDFRVADLAMGSGHFLVAAIDHTERLMASFLDTHDIPKVTDELRYLGRAAEEALGELAPDVEIQRTSLLRRQIARRCIYGLDINPIAVELARVAIWIHTFVPGLAMSSLNHNLVHGNSLTGIGTIDEALDELDPPLRRGKQRFDSIFRVTIEDTLREASSLLSEAAVAAEATARDVHAAEQLAADARAKAAPSKAFFDAAVALRIGLIDKSLNNDAETLTKLVESDQVRDVLERLAPAHMPFLFPEVFLRDHGGFDVLIGNPPWEKIKIEEKVWWGMHIAKLRSMPQAEKNAAIAELRVSRPDLEAAYQREIAGTDFMRKVINKGPYPGIGSGDIDLFQAFAWRNLHLTREDGYFGVVLPRGALAGSGTKLWREEILDNGNFASVNVLTNKGGWIFESVDGRYNVGLVVVQRRPSGTVSFNGPFHSQAEFGRGARSLATVKAVDFKGWSQTFVFPWLPTEESIGVFLQMRSHPRFDSTEGFEFRPVRELDTSIDKRFYDFDLEHPSGDLAVLTGASFEIWNPNHGDPYAFAHSDEVLPFLENKLTNQRNNRRSAFYGLADEALSPRPWERARIAFRDVARSNDSRTMIVCLLPPGALVVHKAPYLLRRLGSELDEAYLLGTLSSLAFDWYARRYVELSMSFELLNPMPVPRPAMDDPLRLRVIEIAGRLAAVDARYAEWAAAVGVGVGTVTDVAEKDDLIAELDALVAILYGLEESQLRHLFQTFHIGWHYEPRLDATLAHYHRWAAKNL